MAFLGARPVTALSPKGDGKTKIDMVLSEELTSAVKYDEELVVEAVHTSAPAARVLKENNYWVACKALIKEVRVAPRKEVLLLRALAIKGRAKTSDPILNSVNGLPDGVAWNVLSFWRVERKKIVPSWGYYDLGALDTPAMAALTTQTEISLNQAKLRGVRDAESQMCRYLSHAIEQLEVSESSTQG